MTSRPNVLVILTDDLGWGDLGCYGSDVVATPHIDALAARGVRLTDWYANAPVCSPTRASLLTGRYPVHAGVERILAARRTVVGLPEQETLASVLRTRGWRTALYGKWHLGVASGSTPMARGFDEYFGIRSGCVDYYSHIMYWGAHLPLHDLWDGDEEVWQNGEYLTHLITRRAVDFIDRVTDPFLCVVSYNAPHYPMHAPAEAMAKFAYLPWERQVMAAMISCVDDGVGELVSALERSGHLDDTLIVFTSDNGPSAEERNWLGGEEIAYQGGSAGGLRGHKGSLFEGGIRVPCIWSWPSVLPSGVVSAYPTASMDLFPTIAGAIGADVADLDGIDLVPALCGRSAEERPLVFEYEEQSAIRVGPWKYVVNPQDRLGGETFAGGALYNLARDPAEQHDISESEEVRHVQHRLSALLEEWLGRFEAWRSDVPEVLFPQKDSAR